MLGRFDDFLHSLGEKDDDESIAGCPLRLAQLLLQATRTPIHVDGLLSAFYRLESIEKQEAYESNKNAFLGAVLEDLMVNEMYDAEIDRLFEEYNVLLKEKEATSGNVLTAGHASPPIGKPLPGPSPYKVGRRGSTSPLESDALFDESTESHRVGKPALDASFSSNASSRYMQPFFFPAPPVASGKESSIKVSVSEEPTSSLPAHAERATGEASPLTSILVTRPHRPSVDVNGSVKADRSRKESINSLTTWRAVPVDTSTVKEHSPSTNNVNSLRQSDMNSLRQSLGASRKNSIFDESKRYVQTVLQRYTAVTSGETDDEESERQNVLMREWIVQQIGILMQWNTLDAMNTPIHEIIEGGSPLRFRGARPLTSLE
ncbi:hypothetical protein AGDE_16731 [Angomonas deanei]|nr:hypothetical protein AGDE_16731 [Angomonas deanei]|eukprot:EPY16320.1 hypothetical protein AGDE_16731 [Angomonas deanei]